MKTFQEWVSENHPEINEGLLKNLAVSGAMLGASCGLFGCNQSPDKTNQSWTAPNAGEYLSQATQTINIGGPRQASVKIQGNNLQVKFKIGRVDKNFGKTRIQEIGRDLGKRAVQRSVTNAGMEIQGDWAIVNLTTN